jgi:hypothetical protein
LLKQRLHRYLHLAESDLVLSLSSIPVTAVWGTCRFLTIF